MSTIEGNRISTHVAPASCQSAADAIAAAAAVRARRRSIFFVYEAPLIAEVAQPVKAEEPEVVPPEKFTGEGVSCLGQLPCLDDIKVAVCNFYRVRAIDLLSERRTNDIVIPRQVAMWIARMTTLKSFPAIGRYFGGRDHSTAVYAVQKIDRLYGDGGAIADQIYAISCSLRDKGLTVNIGFGVPA